LQASLGVQDFSVSETTLDQIFVDIAGADAVKATRQAVEEQAVGAAR
jgi:hypothetical protein